MVPQVRLLYLPSYPHFLRRQGLRVSATPRLLVVLPSLSPAQSTTPSRTSRIQSAEYGLPWICVPPSTMTPWDTPRPESNNPNLGKYLSPPLDL